MKKLLILFTIGFLTLTLKAQVTYETNDPGLNPIPLGYIGWNDNLNTNLDVRQNNIIRMRINNENWPGYNNRPAINNVNRIFLPLNTGITQGNVFSILQLGVDLDVNLQREWMNTGITIGADGNDLLWTGIIPDPDNDDSQQGGDAAIAWGDNAPGQFGPDNLRFLFISQLTAANNGPNSDQGRETMRITPGGNVGMGDSFSNALQPSRRLVVHRQTNAPQFRIA